MREKHKEKKEVANQVVLAERYKCTVHTWAETRKGPIHFRECESFRNYFRLRQHPKTFWENVNGKIHFIYIFCILSMGPF